MATADNIARTATSETVSPVVASDVSQSPEWQLVQRIVASPAFVRSALLTSFLLYVCNRKLHGREEEITEHQIGVNALGRPGNYHPGEDNVVRNSARILRKRLEEFFEEAGSREDLRIVIPRGQYVPLFEPAELARALRKPDLPGGPSAQARHEGVLASAPPATPAFNRRFFLISASAVAGLSVAGWLGFRKETFNSPDHVFHAFWSQIFVANRDCYIVAGDSALVMLQRITGQDIPLNEYIGGTLAADFRELSSLTPLAKGVLDTGLPPHYTTAADLSAAVALDRLAIAFHVNPKIRHARDIRMNEVKHSNGIFIGGPRANPWLELFEPSSNFQMKFYPGVTPDQANQSFWNKRPRPGEQQEYMNSSSKFPFNTYTMVSFVPSVDGEGWALLLQGQNPSGTNAAVDFVTNVNAIAPVLKRAHNSDGSIAPFEVILETRVVGSDAPEARIVVERHELMKP